jgi:hypothetical protein
VKSLSGTFKTLTLPGYPPPPTHTHTPARAHTTGNVNSTLLEFCEVIDFVIFGIVEVAQMRKKTQHKTDKQLNLKCHRK